MNYPTKNAIMSVKKDITKTSNSSIYPGVIPPNKTVTWYRV
jgi:hypothetical protein